MAFAANTSVSPEKSKAEIETLLRKYGADQFASGWDGDLRAVIGFRCKDRFVRFVLTFPARDDKRFRARRQRWNRVTGSYEAPPLKDAYDQEVRRRWRALALVIKAKLEAVETGIETFESAFLANIVMPDGQTVGEHVRPAIATAYGTGQVRGLLPEFGAGSGASR